MSDLICCWKTVAFERVLCALCQEKADAISDIFVGTPKAGWGWSQICGHGNRNMHTILIRFVSRDQLPSNPSSMPMPIRILIRILFHLSSIGLPAAAGTWAQQKSTII